MRLRALLPAAVLFLVSCSDKNALTEARSSTATRQVVAPSGSLDENIHSLFQLFPKGQATAGLNRWTNVKRAYDAGVSNPSKMPLARKQMFQLAEWVRDMTSKMNQPSGGETRVGAASRLTLYMAMYVFDGPSSTPPLYVAGADNAVGLVTPNAGATIVTPSTNAGVSLEAGAVDENTVVIITENPTPYPANCSGPLPTRLCQYPRFYHFSQFPHVRLNIEAKFAVCHVNGGTLRLPLADHDRFRLAHNAPANPANYTPGATQRTTGGENIEILPLITQTFSICDDIEYALEEPTGLRGVLARASSAVERLLTPKSAFAVDQGGGGKGVMFSDFNNIDPDGLPDDSVYSLAVLPDTIYPGDSIFVTYTVKNVLTATAPNVPANITLTPNTYTSVPTPVTLTTFGFTSLVPQQSQTQTTTAFIPTATSPGSYTLTVNIGSDPAFPDSQMGNNSISAIIAVAYPPSVIYRKGRVPERPVQ